VESATHIRVRNLQAIEDEDFDMLPPGMYRRSFLREYAEFLGLDGDAYAAEYELRFARPEPEPEPVRTSARPRLRVGPKALAAAGVVLVVAVGVWLLNRGGAPRTAPPVTTTAAASPPARHRHAPKAAPSGAPPALLISATRGNCWLSVKTGSETGPTVYQQTLQQGESVRFGLAHRLWVRIGAP
jgi:hypothetical protein